MNISAAFSRRQLLAIGLVALIAVGLGGAFTISGDGDTLSIGEEVVFHGTDPFDADTSGNGLLDHEAVAKGLNPTVPDTLGNGLTDYEEVHVYGTDPLAEDTNDDGLSDYDEVHEYGTDPTKLDTTGDGLSDYNEIHTYGTDPTTVDTNDDGLNDYAEIHEYETDPTKLDTNGDGLSDYEEVHVYGTDPLVEDTNGDGLTDAENVNHEADPLKRDTTGDGLTDYEEVHTYGTDPSTLDTNGDGLSDYEEIHTYNTDPTALDTNNDGLSDAANIEHGADPHKVDTNGDGVTDKENVEHGLDPNSINTSGDAFSDYVAIHAGDIDSELDAIDPARMNIIVEIDSMQGSEMNTLEYDKLYTAFDNAPVTNYNGSTGINLVLINDHDSIQQSDSTSPREYMSGSYDSEWSYEGYGAHHAFIVDDAVTSDSEGNVTGYAMVEYDGFVVEDSDGSKYTGSTFMHELGHSLGLLNRVHDGVDTTDYWASNYPSVMNYNDSRYHYSTGGSSADDHDDWGHILENFHDEHPDTSRLEHTLGR